MPTTQTSVSLDELLRRYPADRFGNGWFGWNVAVDPGSINLTPDHFENRITSDDWNKRTESPTPWEAVVGFVHDAQALDFTDRDRIVVMPLYAGQSRLAVRPSGPNYLAREEPGRTRALDARYSFLLEPGMAFVLRARDSATLGANNRELPAPFMFLTLPLSTDRVFTGSTHFDFREWYDLGYLELARLRESAEETRLLLPFSPERPREPLDSLPTTRLASPPSHASVQVKPREPLPQTNDTRSIFRSDGRAAIIPFDDRLIDGAIGRLQRFRETVAEIAEAKPDAVLGMLGDFRDPVVARLLSDNNVGIVSNLTWSSSIGMDLDPPQGAALLDKVLCDADVARAVRQSVEAGATLVSGHVNFTAPTQNDMFHRFGTIVGAAHEQSTQALIHAYWRTLRPDGTIDFHFQDPSDEFLKAQLQMIGWAKGAGADILKVNMPLDKRHFKEMVAAADGIPILIAGGPLEPIATTLKKAWWAVKQGGNGIACGRNTLGPNPPASVIHALNGVVHDGMSPNQAMKEFSLGAYSRDSGFTLAL